MKNYKVSLPIIGDYHGSERDSIALANRTSAAKAKKLNTAYYNALVDAIRKVDTMKVKSIIVASGLTRGLDGREQLAKKLRRDRRISSKVRAMIR